MKDEDGDGSVCLMPSLKYAVQKKPDKKVGALYLYKVGVVYLIEHAKGLLWEGRQRVGGKAAGECEMVSDS